MRRANPKTPVQKMWEQGRKKGLSDHEIATAIGKRWPDDRTAIFLIYNRSQRTVFTRFAKYLVKEGLANDYRYIPKSEVEAGDHAIGEIDIVDRHTPLPQDKLREILDDVGWSGIEIYDDRYIWPEENPKRKKNGSSRTELDAAKKRARKGLPPRNDLERLAVNLVAGEAKVAKMQAKEKTRIAKHRPDDQIFAQVTSHRAFGQVKVALGRTPALFGKMNERKGAPFRFFIRRDEAPKLRGIKVKPARWSDQYFEKGSSGKQNPTKTSGVSMRSIMSKALQ